MSVKIEILDYVFGEFEGAQMITNPSFSSSSNWDLGTGWAIAGGAATHSGGSSGFLIQSNLIFVEGQRYRIKYKISGRTGGSLILANHLAGSANGFVQVNNGTFEYDWVQGGSNNNRLSLFGGSAFDGSVEYVEVYNITGIDWENSVVGELDVTDHSDFPLAMTFQISDFKDLTSTSGDYSKTFKIPATKNNNQIFKNLYIANIDVDNKVTAKKQCRILVNNLYSKVGLIQVNSVSGYGEKPSHYECVFFGNNLTWAAGIQDAYMSDIDWGAEGDGLIYNKDGIVDTWQHVDSDNGANSPIVYPITSYGVYNAGGDQRTIQLLDTHFGRYGALTSPSTLGYYGFNNGQNDYGTPPPSPDWRPTIFVKKTLEKIFSGLGFKISSSFINTDMFKRLVWSLPNFLYNNASERLTIYSYGNSFTGEGLISSFLIDPDNDPFDPTEFSYFTFNIDLNDSAGFTLNTDTDNVGWDATSGIYTVQEYGFHNISLNDFGLFGERVSYTSGSLEVGWTKIVLQVKTVGQTSFNNIASMITSSFIDSGGSPLSDNPAQLFTAGLDETRYLNKGDQLRLVLNVKARTSSLGTNEIRLYLFGSTTPTSTTTSDSANATYAININPEYVDYGQTYNLSEVIDKEMKQIDFVKGIAHAFNLQMTTDEGSKTVHIEPFNDFYKPLKDAIDWTYKLDRSKEINDQWIKSDLKRNIIFKYKSDSADAVVNYRGKKFFNDIQDEYPYWEQLPDTFEKGDSTFENPFFAGTYNAKDNDTTVFPSTNTAYSGCLWTENVNARDEGRPDKGFSFLPRLLYWNKYSPTVPAALPTTKFAFAQTWGDKLKKIIAKQGLSGEGVVSGIFPQATMVNRDSNTSPVLSYGNISIRNYDDATGIYSAEETGAGLYETYYRNLIEMLKLNPRVRSVYVDLKISDIVNLDFTKLIYIDGVYWRISKVLDYMPNKNDSTKVELIEFITSLVYPFNAPVFRGRPRNWASPPSSPFLPEVPQL